MTLTASTPDHAVIPASTGVPVSAQITHAGLDENVCRGSAGSRVREATEAGPQNM